MVFGRLKEAASDVAETLRRAFSSPPCQRVDPTMSTPATGAIPILEAQGLEPAFLLKAEIGRIPVHFPGALKEASLAMTASLKAEEGWAQWAAGAKLCTMDVFRAGTAPRIAVPPLPRNVPTRAQPCGLGGTRSRALMDPLPRPQARSLEASLTKPRAFGSPQQAFELPMGVVPETQAAIPRALWMRYTLQLVKTTDENIRNLDVLGIFPIPTRGVRGLRHDAPSGRLFLELGPEAAGAPKGRLMLARNKTDRSLVSCFLEEG